jgi:hypothetical protein
MANGKGIEGSGENGDLFTHDRNGLNTKLLNFLLFSGANEQDIPYVFII